MQGRNGLIRACALLSLLSPWPTRALRLHASRLGLLEKVLGDPSRLPSAKQVEVCASPCNFAALKEAALAWSLTAEGRGWTLQLQEHVPDDPVARPFHGEVTGYLLGYAVQPLRLRFVARETAGLDMAALEASLAKFLGDFEDQREKETGGEEVWEVAPTSNEFKVLLVGTNDDDGRGRVILNYFDREKVALSALVAEPMTQAESAEATTYENLHVANYNPTALTRERTLGQLEIIRKDLPVAKAAVADPDLKMRRRHCFGEGKATLAQLFQFDWTRPRAVLEGTDSAIKHGVEMIESHEGDLGLRSVQIMTNVKSPSLVKVHYEFDTIEKLLEYLVTEQVVLLERLADHRAEVSPVRQVLRTLDSQVYHSPAARYSYTGRQNSLPSCFVDCFSAADHTKGDVAELVTTAVNFGIRGLCVSASQLQEIDIAHLKSVAPSLHTAVILEPDSPSYGRDLAALGSLSPYLGSILLSVDPANANESVSTATAALQVLRDSSGPLKGIHMDIKDKYSAATAAQTLREISKVFPVEVFACERSVVNPQFEIDAALRDVGLDSTVWLNVNCDANDSIASNKVVEAIMSQQSTLTVRQVVTKWHTYQGDIACLRPKRQEHQEEGRWQAACIQFAKEVCATSILDLKPGYVAALSAMRSS